MKHFLGSISIITLLFASCTAPYRNLYEVKESKSTAFDYKPVFNREIYRCSVDGKLLFKKFHLSGILLFKQLENGDTRVVFQNEMGLSFFDFGWDVNDSVKVYDILPQLQRPAVIKLLEKDLNMFLMRGLDKPSEKEFKKDNELLYRFSLVNGYVYYVVKDGKLMKIVNTGKHSVVTTINLADKTSAHAMPGSVLFTHHKAHFTIQLNKITEHAD